MEGTNPLKVLRGGAKGRTPTTHRDLFRWVRPSSGALHSPPGSMEVGGMVALLNSGLKVDKAMRFKIEADKAMTSKVEVDKAMRLILSNIMIR